MCSSSSLLRARNVWTFIDSLTSECMKFWSAVRSKEKKKQNWIEQFSFSNSDNKKNYARIFWQSSSQKNSNYYFEIRVINNEEKRKKMRDVFGKQKRTVSVVYSSRVHAYICMLCHFYQVEILNHASLPPLLAKRSKIAVLQFYPSGVSCTFKWVQSFFQLQIRRKKRILKREC